MIDINHWPQVEGSSMLVSSRSFIAKPPRHIFSQSPSGAPLASSGEHTAAGRGEAIAVTRFVLVCRQTD